MEASERFQRAVAEFERLNARDPNSKVIDARSIPYEVFFADRMTQWVEKLKPDASEAVQLAARCQHLCRWEIPRNTYPEGRVGYLTWRKDLKSFHADKSAEVLRSVGYDEDMVERVRTINLKKGLGRNEEVQLIEDALCLVFLEQQYDDLIAKTEDTKMISILRKTWGKMSEQAQQEALRLELSEKGSDLIKQALGA